MGMESNKNKLDYQQNKAHLQFKQVSQKKM